jgi:uncharacterized protein (TIGR03000 family)
MFAARPFAAGAACSALGLLAAFAAPARAQITSPGPGQPAGFVTGSPYSYRPLLPFQPYGPRVLGPSYWGPGYTPIFMTTLNTPGVYGQYTMGVTPRELPTYNQATFYSSVTATDWTPTLTATVSPRAELRGMAPGAAPATVSVRLPADAVLTFDGTPTDRTGPAREFVTPPLEVGRDFRYIVRATWNQDGREVRQDRDVTVRAGERVNVDFTGPPAAESTLRTRPPEGSR